MTYGRLRTVPGEDSRLVREGQKPLGDASHKEIHAPARQIHPTHAPREERVPREDEPFLFYVLGQVSRRVPRAV